jgi:hypothetical protein
VIPGGGRDAVSQPIERVPKLRQRLKEQIHLAGGLFMFRYVLSLRCVVCLTFLPVSLSAQTDRATLTGTITDQTGAVVPGAVVSIKSAATQAGHTATTNAAGAYTFDFLPVGEYEGSVTAKGFGTVRIDAFTLDVGQIRTLNEKLTVGDIVSQVTVQATSSALDQSSAEIGGVIQRSQIQDIPLNGRNWASLMSLTPGAIDSATGVESGVRFAGLSQEDNNFLFDGVDATGINHAYQQTNLRLQISTEAIQEFRASATTYAADKGFTPGGQVEIVSRTGTNQFHGAAFEFFRNSVFDARPFNALSLPPFHLNNFGASFGGPIIKNKLFFFVNYEGLRQVLGQPLTAVVPADAYRALVIQKSPALAPLVNAYPHGTASTNDPNALLYYSFGRQQIDEDSGMFRIDYLMSSKTTMFVRYSTDHSTQPSNSDNVGGRSFANQNMPNAVIDLQHNFSATILNDAKFAFNRSENHSGTQGILPTGLSITGFDSIGGTGGSPEVLNAYSAIDNATFLHGRHAIKAGFEFRRIQSNKGSAYSETYSYNNQADFANNVMNSDSVSPFFPDNGVRKSDYFAYVLDEFKLRPNLTINMGLRYENLGVPYEVLDRGRAFDPYSCPNLYCAPSDSWYFPNSHDFAPRIGIAWSPKAFNGKTVIRAGWGIFYGEGQFGPLAGPYKNQLATYTLTQTTAPGLSYPVTPYLGYAIYSLSPSGLDRHKKDLYIGQWSFSIQHEIARQTTVQLSYFGNEGTHEVNKIILNGGNPATGQRPYANFSTISYFTTNGVGNFNALQASLMRNISTGLLISANYQWSHAIDDGSLGGGEFIAPENANCRSCERASSTQDMRQYFASSAIWKIPVGRGQRVLRNASPVANVLLGGWQLSGIGTARTGLPLNVTITRSASALPDQINSNQRPNCVAGASLYPAQQTVQQWVNPAAFATPAVGTWGNCGRDLVRAPGLWQMDTALQKREKIGERMGISFRAELFNIFNRAQYGSPKVSLPSGNFGLITSAFNNSPTGTGTPRKIELMLRLDF